MKTQVVYHANCNDGAAAALIAEHTLGRAINLIPAQYGQPFNLLELRHTVVYILDFSFDRETMLSISEESQLVCLDHHRTAQKALEGIPGCTFDMDKCGARLTWEHFHGEKSAAPWWVEYIEDRDLWRWNLPYSKAINAALRSYGVNLEGLREALLWEDGEAKRMVDQLIRDGESILREQEGIVQAHVERAELITFFGMEVPVVNATVLQSEIAGDLATGHPFGAVWFEEFDGTRVWSLRSRNETVNVAELAETAGGGGHPGAAGFKQRPGDPLP
jgi:oligoribonuclease NrnB/cAMP/cGMP phosphodiesterase (DHH superfamily)